MRTVVADHLRAAGCEVQQFADGADAWQAIRERMPDLLILDRMLPGLDGDELAVRIRAISSVPIIMLTALDGLEHRIEGLEHGADDYLGKPFSLRELQLRVNAQLRRSSAVAPLGFTAGRFRVDPEHRRVWSGEREIALTTREYELFLYLVRNPDRVVSREEILREVWQWGFGDASTVTVHVRRLREKIEPDPRIPSFLHTEWGAGYRFTLQEVPA
ncbi:response regulator transcription factor [Gryllotalpicola koreensis]|uniref:Response regulator transcription factor n=1 Tax=Gryllotalpicola koreensis TaxID=993086 RepID=A0ABP8ACZ9_9MICO